MMTDMIDYVKSIFSAPSPETLALRELEDARRKLLEAQSAREFADSMCRYHEARIARLTMFLRNVSVQR